MNVNTVLSAMHAMSEEDVRKINEAAYTILKTARDNKIRQTKRGLHVGMSVTFGPAFNKRTGVIEKINRTKCVVDTGGIGGRFNVPITMLKPAV